MNPPSFYLQLVNPKHPVLWRPSENQLCAFHPGFPHVLLESCAARSLAALLEELDAFGEIVPVSGYRPRAMQQEIWDDTVQKQGLDYARQYVAIPGCSEHETGLAIDLAANRPEIDFICPDFPWDGIFGKFRRMAPEYGWILRYPAGKEEITRISSEPWHFRYVGTPHARILSDRGLVLEEYLAGDPGLPLWNGPQPGKISGRETQPAAGRRP